MTDSATSKFVYTPLDRVAQAVLLRAILDETKFVQDTHKLLNADLTRMLTEAGYKTEVFIQIAPYATLYSAHGAHRHEARLDLRDFPDGLGPICKEDEHTLTEFYWEVGGGGLDSGTPHRYVCCTDCGKKYTQPLLQKMPGWFGSPTDGRIVVRQARR